jgi:hypothetical protein
MKNENGLKECVYTYIRLRAGINQQSVGLIRYSFSGRYNTVLSSNVLSSAYCILSYIFIARACGKLNDGDNME